MIDWDGAQVLVARRVPDGDRAGVARRQADPMFAELGSGDFHLLAGSPAIDSANSGAGGQPATDFDGTARVDDPGHHRTPASARSPTTTAAPSSIGLSCGLSVHFRP